METTEQRPQTANTKSLIQSPEITNGGSRVKNTDSHLGIGKGELAGKVVLVTGAGSGIGRAAAIRLAAQGAYVCLVDRNENQTEEVRTIIEVAHGSAIVQDVDVSDEARVKKAFQTTMDKWGRLDMAFVNAGINGTLAPIEDMTAEQWDETISINLRGTFLCVKYAVACMKEKGGSIVITSSINGNRTFSNLGMSAYSTSKAAQVAFMKMAALELARYRIRVNAICPGAIETNIDKSTHPEPSLEKIKIPVDYPQGNQPLEHGPGSAEQVAELVYFLATDASSHITGTEIYIDGAESLL